MNLNIANIDIVNLFKQVKLEMEEKITEAARKSGVPVYEDDSLATLLSRLQLGAAVPEELYQAIIEIYIYFLGYVPSPEEKENEEKVENT